MSKIQFLANFKKLKGHQPDLKHTYCKISTRTSVDSLFENKNEAIQALQILREKNKSHLCQASAYNKNALKKSRNENPHHSHRKY